MGGIIFFRIVRDILWNCLLLPKMKHPPISMITLVARLSCIIILTHIMILDGARPSAEGTCSILYDTIADPISTVSSYFPQGPSTHPCPYTPQGDGIPGQQNSAGIWEFFNKSCSPTLHTVHVRAFNKFVETQTSLASMFKRRSDTIQEPTQRKSRSEKSMRASNNIQEPTRLKAGH